MKTIEKKQLTNSEINALAMEYKATYSEQVFNDLMASVKNLVETIAFKYYNHSRGLNIPEDDFTQEAYLAVFTAVESYDAEKGGNFTTHVKRLVEWKIQDNIIKTSKKKSEQFQKHSLSLDVTVNGGQDSFLSAVEHQFATEADEVYNSAIETEDATATLDVFAAAKGLVSAFSQDASEDDKVIIETTFAVILTASDESGDIKRKITKALSDALNVTSATARKKKSRAFARFEAYAVEKNMPIDMSQF